MIAVIGMTEVLLARMVSAPHVALDLGEELLLERQVLEHGLDHVVGVAHRFGEIGAAARPARPRSRRRRGRAGWRRCATSRCRGFARTESVIVDVMAGERENLRDAVPHQAGADDGNARAFAAMCQPAV